jgi:hypothetical protein
MKPMKHKFQQALFLVLISLLAKSLYSQCPSPITCAPDGLTSYLKLTGQGGLKTIATFSYNNGITFDAQGTAPDITFKSLNSAKMTLTGAGNLGIGITNPSAKLHINGSLGTTSLKVTGTTYIDADYGLWIEKSSWGTYKTKIAVGSSLGQRGLRIEHFNGNTPVRDALFLGFDGNVGIGTADPTSALTVMGEITCSKVRVKDITQLPDYVFETNYDLLSIEEMNVFIKNHKHLPEIPTADMVEKEGIELGEMNILLLKKVEEQMLYIIELSERIKVLEQQSIIIN